MRLEKHHKRVVFWVCLLAIGAAWIYWRVELKSRWALPSSMIMKTIRVEGVVASIPLTNQKFRYSHRRDRYKQPSINQNFYFQTQTISHRSLKHLLRLTWYRSKKLIHIGERWRFDVRLKPVHGLQNPGGHNYVRQLRSRGVEATGYIVSARYLGKTSQYQIDRWRAALANSIRHRVHNHTLAHLITALTVGMRSQLTQFEKNVLQRTGTSHLLAISGLHIGLAAGIVYWLFNFLWRLWPSGMQFIPAFRVGAIGAIMGALSYGLLAGFSLPTQRAVIMVFCMTLNAWTHRQISLTRRLLFAFVIILLFQPFAIFSPSLWLSFAAVGFIAYGMIGCHRDTAWWKKWLRLQCVVSVGLLPFVLFYFQQATVLMILANLIAVPWVSLFVVPLCLIASAGWHSLFKFAALLLKPLWWLLTTMAQWPHILWQHPITQPLIVIAIVCALLLVLMPRGMPARYLSVIPLLSLWWWTPTRPGQGEVWLTVFDVGQGLATLIQTQHHTLIYDTGPSYPDGFDAGRDVLLPFLRMQQLGRVDTLIVSHADNDHIGGARSLLHTLPVSNILTSEPRRLARFDAHRCHAGQHWSWDKVTFRILFPGKRPTWGRNNGSCVLSVTANGRHLLLVGDIEAPAEEWLLRHRRRELGTDVLVAPHHGSQTSSTPAFVRAVHPRRVIFASGFYNRYHFPAAEVVRRYKGIDAKTLNTAEAGAISVRVSSMGKVTWHTFAKG